MQLRKLHAILFTLFAATAFAQTCSQTCGQQNCCSTPSGTQCYYPSTHTCTQDTKSNYYVCPTGYSSCAGACYLPKDYCCPNGQLTQASACPTSQLPSLGFNYIESPNNPYPDWNDYAYYKGPTYNYPGDQGFRVGDDFGKNLSKPVFAPARPMVLSFYAKGGAAGGQLSIVFNGQTVFTQNGAFPNAAFTYFSFAVNGDHNSFLQLLGQVQNPNNVYFVNQTFLGLNPDYYPLSDGNYIVPEAFYEVGYTGNSNMQQIVYTPANVAMTLSFTVNAGSYPQDGYYFDADFNGNKLVNNVRLPPGTNNFMFQVQSAANGINTFTYSYEADGRQWSVNPVTLTKN